MMVVFATNLKPDDPAGATFLRRIENKGSSSPHFPQNLSGLAIQKKFGCDPEILN
jgi:hypothetical protein